MLFLFVFRRPFAFRGRSPRYGGALIFRRPLFFVGEAHATGLRLFSDDLLFSVGEAHAAGLRYFQTTFCFRGRSPRYGVGLFSDDLCFSGAKPALRGCARLVGGCGFAYLKFNIGQPFALASCSSSASGLTATGSLTRRSSGRSFLESL